MTGQYTLKTLKHSIKTVRSSIVPIQLIQPGYATDDGAQRLLYTPVNTPQCKLYTE